MSGCCQVQSRGQRVHSAVLKRMRRSRLNVRIACGKLLAAFSFACGPYFSSITPTNQLYYAWNVSCDPKGQSSSHQFIYSNLDYIQPLFSFMISITRISHKFLRIIELRNVQVLPRWYEFDIHNQCFYHNPNPLIF